jgi:4-aminobutyrate aminotransferase-like enzyme
MPRPAADLQRALFRHRVLTGTASDPAILRLLPALSFSIGEADLLLDALHRVVQ